MPISNICGYWCEAVARIGRRLQQWWRGGGIYVHIYIHYNNISGHGGSGGGSVLMGAILLRQMLICYIVKTPDGLTDSEI